jgi:putative spermidine/putrescine transport system ATP-binding protein
VLGHVRDVVYLGSDTKYHVTLDVGGELAVIKQNVATSSMDALALKGAPVRLIWDRRHTLPVAMTPEHAAEGAAPGR